MNELSKLTPDHLSFREGITHAEKLLTSCPQLTLKVIHHFAPGIYARELHIPAGTVLTGKIHKTQHLFILSAGVIEQVSEQAGLETIAAPFTCISQPGAKRMGVCLVDAVVTTVHATDETDIDKLDDDLVCNSYEEYEKFLLASSNVIEVLQ